jgi:hypothetical protein
MLPLENVQTTHAYVSSNNSTFSPGLPYHKIKLLCSGGNRDLTFNEKTF